MVKIERSKPAPKSLQIAKKKGKGSYRREDVIDRLREDFHDKCYLCETKGLQDPEVEHRLPHQNGKNLKRKYDWNNLFWSCGHCNNVKNKYYYSKNIIDCCKVDPEELLVFVAADESIQIEPVNKKKRSAKVTADLLNDVYNLTNTGIRLAACDNRVKGVFIQMNLLFNAINNYIDDSSNKDYEDTLKALLSRESEYAAFKRSYIRENKDLYPDVYGLIDEE
ncbi:TIGR02646 family protein [Butyrivibrio hungatei DSM 14810]|uniref:TIGR02646 family protein n=1 Tax=Butyrivibrio hungatei DSM 14810 TaxID=1121132 RepID=A0A1M7T0N3_9FIRM|nr:hypothetical protein [Butyrivibrio hungatei]SHN64289.1 TIGR02646 family protein [Butyrivibrio hungatei DSM 14810]